MIIITDFVEVADGVGYKCFPAFYNLFLLMIDCKIYLMNHIYLLRALCVLATENTTISM